MVPYRIASAGTRVSGKPDRSISLKSLRRAQLSLDFQFIGKRHLLFHQDSAGRQSGKLIKKRFRRGKCQDVETSSSSSMISSTFFSPSMTQTLFNGSILFLVCAVLVLSVCKSIRDFSSARTFAGLS